MKLSKLEVLALLIACGAFLFVVVDLGAEAAARYGASPDEVRIDQLTARANRMARELEIARAELEERAAAIEAVRRQVPAVSEDTQAALRELAERVDRIERLALPRREGDAFPSTVADVAREHDRVTESAVAHDAVDRFRGVFLDSEQSVESRLGALRMLRMFPREMQVYDDRVIDEAVTMLETSEEDRVRERVIKEVSHVRDDRLMGMWAHLLRVESNDGIRSEAAESLVTFLGREEARAALEQAYAQDPSERVRLDAGLALRAFEDDDPADREGDVHD